MQEIYDWSPPARVVWIEIVHLIEKIQQVLKSPPARVVWIEISKDQMVFSKASGRHPRGWCGLK